MLIHCQDETCSLALGRVGPDLQFPDQSQHHTLGDRSQLPQAKEKRPHPQ